MSGSCQHCHGKHSSRIKKITRKRVFAEFVKSKQFEGSRGNDDSKLKPPSWLCCDETFTIPSQIHKHVAQCHRLAVDEALTFELDTVKHRRKHCNVNEAAVISIGCDGLHGSGERGEDCECASSKDDASYHNMQHPQLHVPTQRDDSHGDGTFPWLPSREHCDIVHMQGKGQILLYYKYVDIQNPAEVADWQRELCRRLRLTGKIRLASEGMNGTVGGSSEATRLYVQATMAHPLFQAMTSQDFKRSSGDSSHFPKGLKVGVFQEIVPMGVDPTVLSYKQAGSHLTPSEFHREMVRNNSSEKGQISGETLFLDCRNFYESKIGQFKGAVTPNIRKFSYWPEYVDRNLDLFRDKRVVMYCTGGIRCERGSAYLKSKGVCKEIYQLEGGVHRYLEEYPRGYFQGKLFVFDDRYAIKTNDEVVASCFHCSRPWDQYQPCSSDHCHQLVLACPVCRASGQSACCAPCGSIDRQALAEGRRAREECLCTRNRERVPVEK